MVHLLLSGCCGRMGQVITGLAEADPNITVAAGVDVCDSTQTSYPVFKSFEEVDRDVDVIVDFSSPKAFDALMDYAEEKEIPAVVCTTGLSDEQLSRLEDASRKVAVLRSANMSLGINLMEKVLKEVSRTLTEAGFDVEIVEEHHRNKKDAPSGTAIALADAVNDSVGGKYEYVYGRSDRYEARGDNEIGISSVRGGSIVGDHEVIFAGTDEVITFKHTAYSRAIFAKVALQGAKFLAGKPAGFYTMSDVIG